MRLLLLLPLVASCDAPPEIGNGSVQPNSDPPPVVAVSPSPSVCAEDWSKTQPGVRRDAGPHSFLGDATGAWVVHGRAGSQVPDGFFVYMSDTNDGVAGSLLVHMMNSGGRSTEVFVRAFGSSNGASESFAGKAWRRATTKERSARVKAALIRLAEQAATECGGRMSSLKEELATFDAAFAAFDRREP